MTSDDPSSGWTVFWSMLTLVSAACSSTSNQDKNSRPGTMRGVSGSAASFDAGSAGEGDGPVVAAADAAGGTADAGEEGAGDAAAAGGGEAGASSGAGGAANTSDAGATGAVPDAGVAGTGGATAADAGMHAFHAGCLDGITDYGNAGPFAFELQTQGQLKLWVPKLPAGCKVPIIHLAVGTGATCDPYAPSLERMASHGFLAICLDDPSISSGDPGTMVFDVALAAYPDLAGLSFGTTGHETGGSLAFTMLQHAEEKWGNQAVYAGLATEPASGSTQLMNGTWQEVYAKLRAPMFMWSALGTDGVVSQAWVQQAYDATSPTEEAYFWTADGAKHIPVPNAEEQQIAIPWFRWKLLGDEKACEFFKAIPTMDPHWAEVASKNAQPCQ